MSERSGPTPSTTILPLPEATWRADRLTSRFLGGADILRSRSVSGIVHSGQVDVPAPPARLVADWERDIALQLRLAPGDVEPLPLARTRARWPDHRRCVQAASEWLGPLGLHEVLATAETALMACRGARYHHDGAQYGGSAFCNLFLSEDRGLDVHFPATGRRVALRRGTLLVFDTGQPHAVVPRGKDRFDVADFAEDRDCTQVFLTWELPIEHPRVAEALGIAFDVEPAAGLDADEEGVRIDGRPVSVCPASGRWLPAEDQAIT